ncbi:hypothetical protein HK096_011401 [Nowakowskiella sp. JEL0078]|nr:hypothetical protein HK096_011401 [Nowakowskiella sp. JEL0078]
MKKIQHQSSRINGKVVSTEQLSPKLDISTTAPRFLPPGYDFGARPKRMFGLPEAKTFNPTPEEFADPLKYIKSIRVEGEKYGICRIVPPAGWNPTFGMDSQKFHQQQRTPFTRVPVLDKKPVDLFHLKKEVVSRGGYHSVTDQKKWAEVGRAIGHTSKTCTSMSSSVKSIYMKWILPYEEYIENNSTGGASSEDEEDEKDDTRTTRSRRKKGRSGIIFYLSIYKSHLFLFTLARKRRYVIPEHVKGELCELCGSNSEEKLVICSECSAGFHAHCLSPPLTGRPPSDWNCPNCLRVSGNDYGFEEGEERTLHDFQNVANDFKEKWFSKNKGTNQVTVTEDEVEREFWRLVESPYEDVEVEYGADLHSSHHGSGFPTAEKDPLNKYSRCGWNLNNISLLPESLFCNIHNDISGMMIPWLYVGMVFSTFCWHTEDHYTYSVNYHHWGETKTWYGIPSSSADKFEETMRKKVPELFDSNPDLLFHLTTILSPGTLLKNGVQVYALDQRPGDFVITFPRSYHAGFNHGVSLTLLQK